MKSRFFLILTTIVCVLTVKAQTPDPCNFDTYQRANKHAIKKAELIIGKALQEASFKKQAAFAGVRTIPVVVHVIHTGGSENISDAQIQSQIDVLNEDFRKKAGTKGDGLGVDTKIEFSLAKISPTGHCTNGIVRVQSSLSNHLTYQRSQLKQLSYWDNTRYLNMYIVKSINNGSGIAGYSSFPGGPADEDGIVVLYNYFGRVGNIVSGTKGRTTTHEIAHWFGLYHTFNNGCGIDTCTDGDLVCDTPPAANPNYGCPKVNSCKNDSPDLDDQVANYCDYSDDACKSMFTAGQAARMEATLSTFRTHIWSDSNLVSTGCDTNYTVPDSCLPLADFTSLSNRICVGSSIAFFNRSLNAPTSLSWSFPGGTPATSASNNPTVKYSSTGEFSVSLIVSNAKGTDTLELLNYVVVAEPEAGLASTWGDSFENTIFPNNGLVVDNPDMGITWERTTDASVDGEASVRIQNAININYGQSDALVLPRLDFTAYPSPIKMAFKWAYARGDANYSDELIVLVSSDCGTTWSQRFYKTGSALATGPTQTSLFVPNKSQWKLAAIDLSTYATSNHVDIKIVNVTDGGNALYIDSLSVGNYNFDTSGTGLKEVMLSELMLYPNPVANVLNIGFANNKQAVISEILIQNTLGETRVFVQNLNQASYALNTAQLASGVYTIRVKYGNAFTQQKFVKN